MPLECSFIVKYVFDCVTGSWECNEKEVVKLTVTLIASIVYAGMTELGFLLLSVDKRICCTSVVSVLSPLTDLQLSSNM